MATSAQTLFNESKCYNCASNANTAQMLRLALLRRQLLALVPTADVSFQGLMTYGNCFACFGITEADILEMALLDKINTQSA
jgi:hypothetical protein